MFTKQSTHTASEQAVADDGFISAGMLLRLLIIALFVFPVVFNLFAMGVDAQIVQVCSRSNINNGANSLPGTVRGVLSLLTVAAALSGTVAIALGFAADSAPFIDGSFSNYKKKGLVYGWGFVVILLFLSLGQSIIGLDLGCFFPV